MRAVWLGLLGAVLAGGAAQAKVCRLDGLELIATQRGSTPSAHAGAKFKVVRKASTTKGASGFIAVELESSGKKFFVDQSYIPNSAPWVSATSWSSGQAGSNVDWKRRDRKAEDRLFGPDGTFDVYSGPLEGLLLEPTNCP